MFWSLTFLGTIMEMGSQISLVQIDLVRTIHVLISYLPRHDHGDGFTDQFGTVRLGTDHSCFDLLPSSARSWRWVHRSVWYRSTWYESFMFWSLTFLGTIIEMGSQISLVQINLVPIIHVLISYLPRHDHRDGFTDQLRGVKFVESHDFTFYRIDASLWHYTYKRMKTRQLWGSFENITTHSIMYMNYLANFIWEKYTFSIKIMQECTVMQIIHENPNFSYITHIVFFIN